MARHELGRERMGFARPMRRAWAEVNTCAGRRRRWVCLPVRTVVRFLVALALLVAALPSCVNWTDVDLAFCDPGEGCDPIDPFFCHDGNELDGICFGPNVVCGDIVCDDICVAAWTCQDHHVCIAVELVPTSDGDSCTKDWCDPETGEINHKLICAP